MKKLTTLLTLFISITCFSQTYTGLYVNDFKNIITDPVKEIELLDYAQNNGFNYLILYNLTYIGNNIFDVEDITESLPLANFINTAKTIYGIQQVAVVGEKDSSFDKMKTYNSFYPTEPNKRFDVFNLEFEFWNTSLVETGGYYCDTYLTPNSLPCTIAGAFDFYDDQLALMKTYGDTNNIIAETYIGYPDAAQSTIITANTHRVLVHYYRTSDVYGSGDSIYQYNSNRIEELATATNVTIMPIFSARPSHMYTWLLTNPITQPYNTFLNGTNGYLDQTGDWKDNITFDGYVWYRYTDLLEINNTLSTTNQAFEEPFIYQLDKTIHFENFLGNSTGYLYNLNGQKITSFNTNSILSTSGLSTGIYVIKITQKGMVFTKKVKI